MSNPRFKNPQDENLFEHGELLTVEEALKFTGLTKRELLISALNRVQGIDGASYFPRTEVHRRACALDHHSLWDL
jgi:hypothetical protein